MTEPTTSAAPSGTVRADVRKCPKCGHCLTLAQYKNIPIYVCKNEPCMTAFTFHEIEIEFANAAADLRRKENIEIEFANATLQTASGTRASLQAGVGGKVAE